MSIDEFIVIAGISCESFCKLVFRIFDKNNSGNIDFEEFITTLWNYCSFDKDSISAFAFQLFDTDSSGVLSGDEVRFMVNLVWGFSPNRNVIEGMKSLDFDGDGDISIMEFCDRSKHLQSLLSPAFEMQQILRTECLGDHHWTRLTERRVAKHNFRTIFEILDRIGGEEQGGVFSTGHHMHCITIYNNNTARQQSSFKYHLLIPSFVLYIPLPTT